jgi:hypothetical protein
VSAAEIFEPEGDFAPPIEHGIHIHLHLEARDEEGRVLATRDDPMDESLVALMGLMFGIHVSAGNASTAIDTLNVDDITGTSRTGQLYSQAASSNPLQVAFGTSSTAVTFTDHVIGAAAGGTNPVVPTATVISSNTFVVTANWTNTTGSTVSIHEVGLYWTQGSTSGRPWQPGSETYMLTHDVFAAVSIPNNATCYAVITFTFT